MSGSSRGWGIAGIIAMILAIGAVVGWRATKQTAPSEPSSGPEASSFGLSSTNRVPFFPLNPRGRPGGESSNQVASPSSGIDTNLIADWADKLDDILGSDG